MRKLKMTKLRRVCGIRIFKISKFINRWNKFLGNFSYVKKEDSSSENKKNMDEILAEQPRYTRSILT